MKSYSSKIALVRNSREVYCLDTSIGCASGMANEINGCYQDCYAAKSAKLYGFDFSNTVLRDFENEKHRREIVLQISKIKLDFVRIGCSGDPSENWGHTLKIIDKIKHCNKQIVIITKHWTNLTDQQLSFLNTVNICINTSVSALDKPELLHNSLAQFERVKPYCKSILRIVSASFNLDNSEGHRLAKIQADLFLNQHTLDTVLRVNPNNPLIKDGIINVKKGNFLGKKTLMSKFNRKTYTGKCSNCHEMCGVKMNNPHLLRQPLLTQTTLF